MNQLEYELDNQWRHPYYLRLDTWSKASLTMLRNEIWEKRESYLFS